MAETAPEQSELYLPGKYKRRHLGGMLTVRRTNVRIWLLDQMWKRIGGAPYTLRMDGIVRTGTATPEGALEELDVPCVESCEVEWSGAPESDGVAVQGESLKFSRVLRFAELSPEERRARRQLDNLGYGDGDVDAGLEAFSSDYYPGTVERLFRDFKVRGIGYRLGRQWVPPNLRPRHPRTHHLLNPTAVEPYPTLEHFLWLSIAHQAEAECHVIAAAFRLACRATGVGGAMDVGYMMPLPGRLEQPPSYPRRSDRLKGRLNQQTVRRGGGVLAFFDAHGQANEFEGVVTYNRALYAIGDAIFDRFRSDVAGTSAEDLNASDYFTFRRTPPSGETRSAILDESAGSFDLAFVDGEGHILPEQYPWSAMPDGHPHMLRDQPFRWED